MRQPAVRPPTLTRQSDLHGSAEYRKKVAAALVRRGLRDATANATRGSE